MPRRVECRSISYEDKFNRRAPSPDALHCSHDDVDAHELLPVSYTHLGRRGYRSFLRFVGECDGVINLTAGSILGRITFLAAALGRPGIFSDNSQLNARLYPGSVVAMFDTVRLRELVRAMLLGLDSTTIVTHQRLLPSPSAAAEVGDFAANRLRLSEILEGSPPPHAPGVF